MKSFLFVIALILLVPSVATAEEFCVYVNEQGMRRKVRSLRQIPKNLRSRAQCVRSIPQGASSGVSMAQPSEIELGGNLRKERLTSSVGPINLRWPRTAARRTSPGWALTKRETHPDLRMPRESSHARH